MENERCVDGPRSSQRLSCGQHFGNKGSIQIQAILATSACVKYIAGKATLYLSRCSAQDSHPFSEEQGLFLRITMNRHVSHHSDMRKALLRTRMEQARHHATTVIDDPLRPMLDEVHGMLDNLKASMHDYLQERNCDDVQALEKEEEYRELLRSLLQTPGTTAEMRQGIEDDIVRSVAVTKGLEKVIQERRQSIQRYAAGPSTGSMQGNKRS